jgi:L-amino acid N-acyltransferase
VRGKEKICWPEKEMGLPIIRDAKWEDLPAITEIYNEAVRTTTATFDMECKTLTEQKRWFEHHGEKHPVLVAEENGIVRGWASLTQWSDRLAYAGTAEVSFYVQESSRGQGIGRKLLQDLVARGESVGLHTLIARITEGNPVSVHLHEAFGFNRIGIMKEVGRKFGRLLDVDLMQKIYPDPTGRPSEKGSTAR